MLSIGSTLPFMKSKFPLEFRGSKYTLAQGAFLKPQSKLNTIVMENPSEVSKGLHV